MFPQHRQRVLMHIQEIAIEKTGAYIYSRALLAVVAAFVTWIALRLIGVPFAEPLALWVGVLSQFVPVVGTYLGGILPVLIALLESPVMAVWVVVFIVLYQQFENYVVEPADHSPHDVAPPGGCVWSRHHRRDVDGRCRVH